MGDKTIRKTTNVNMKKEYGKWLIVAIGAVVIMLIELLIPSSRHSALDYMNPQETTLRAAVFIVGSMIIGGIVNAMYGGQKRKVPDTKEAG